MNSPACCTLLILGFISSHCALAQSEWRLTGDVGLALYRTPPVTQTRDPANITLPFAYADYGPLYARVDTFGYKMMPFGQGHLELATRISVEGFRPANGAFQERSSPHPIGFGTFQEGRYGALFAYAFKDSVSGGSLLELSYAAELDLGRVHVYPQLGIERRSAKYVQHLYGISADEALRTGVAAYSAGNSTTPNAALTLEYVLQDNLKLSCQVRKRWLDKSIYASPLVVTKSQTTSMLALTRTFK